MTLSFMVDYLRKVFTRFPPLPTRVVQTIVAYAPFVVAGIAVLNLGVVVLEFIEGTPMLVLSLSTFYLSSGLAVIFSVVLLLAVRPLTRRSGSGWRTILALNSLFTILSILLFGLDNLFVAALVYYVLFQVEPYYH